MGIRKYKPTTPGRRGSSVADFVEVTRSEPEKSPNLAIPNNQDVTCGQGFIVCPPFLHLHLLTPVNVNA